MGKKKKKTATKIVFLFGGALTAIQHKVVQGEIDAGHDVSVANSITTDLDYDLLVYGSGFAGLNNLTDAIPFAEFQPSKEIEIDEIIEDIESVDDCCALDVTE